MGYRAVGQTRRGIEADGRRPDRLFVRRERSAREHSGRRWLPDGFRRTHPGRNRSHDGRRRDDNFPGSGGAHHSDGKGGCGEHGTRIFARSVLALARGSRAPATDRVADPISPGRSERRSASAAGRSEELRIVFRGTAWRSRFILVIVLVLLLVLGSV